MIIWVAMAFSTKRTVKSSGGWTMRIIAIAVVVFAVFLRGYAFELLPFLDVSFWPHSLVSGIIADILVVVGMAIMLCARFTLGRNWSANVVLKENHELVTKGPYKYVRHPIYSGLLLMILSTAVYSASVFGFIIFIAFFFGAYYKARKEEKLMIEKFPEEYPQYMGRVKALVPFVF